MNSTQNYPGNLFVVAAPSGAGKSSLVNALMEVDSRLAHSVSHTTRAPRGQEVHGREYYFVSNAQFEQMISQDAFLEWAHVHGNRYGTSKHAIEERIAQGGDIILEIDYQGAIQVKKIFANAVLIFILPPSWEELKSRLQRRGEDSTDVIEQRLINAAKEVAQVREFDFVIINERFELALFDLKSIVHAQRLKYSAQRRTKADTFRNLHIS
ncbi:MAG TPA: guanylate kinase [Burkholderiaceae bacterium]|nr:guanylate kinase [Burkholderiaceae bacterium]